ncbi:ranBP2-type zinc finger protein At1g67325-like [Typha angustifolia]|uniref:ranBP2-type zinc finger protein At1g67325-like n=1 Tax=Typha angustifolia TaxID=59011 RepID=UPI003C2EA102
MASAKVDSRGSFGSKRSRNDASARDGDWTCPQCGNMNFSFRTVCNRGACGAPRPTTSPSPRMGPTPIAGGYDHPAPFYYGGVGAPPPIPLGISGSYGAPFPHLGLRYDYGPAAGALGAYGHFSSYGPPGPMGGGMGYGPGPGMDRYGYGFRGSPMPVSSPWSGGALLDNNASRKRRGGPDGLSEGDWICPKCDNVNFKFRTTCNMKKCGTPRPTSAANRGSSSNKDYSDAPEGSWSCTKCNNLNYPFRTVCNRKGCGSDRPSTSN